MVEDFILWHHALKPHGYRLQISFRSDFPSSHLAIAILISVSFTYGLTVHIIEYV